MFLDNILIAKNSGANRGKNSSNLICSLFLWKLFYFILFYVFYSDVRNEEICS